MTCAKKKRIQTRSYGKVEFCLPTKLRARRATSSTFASLHSVDVLNAFGLFALAAGQAQRRVEAGMRILAHRNRGLEQGDS